MTRLLIVDDRADNRYVLRALMEGHGFKVDEANHGAQALAMARQNLPELIISDLLMPVMDGYTLLREWKADSVLSTVPFMVYTATYTEAKDEKLAVDMGADAFLIKPSEPDAFLTHVQHLLEMRSKSADTVRKPTEGESTTIKRYNEVLIKKLEKRSAELEVRVTELNAAQFQVLRLNRLYMALSEINQAIVHTSNQQALFHELCRVAVERGGLAMVWVGSVEPTSGRIEPVARAGAEPTWLPRLGPLVSTGSGPKRDPSEIVFATQRPYLSNDLQNDTRIAAISDDLRQCGLQSAACYLLRVDEKPVACVSLFAAEKNFFDNQLLDLVTEIATDTSFALTNFAHEADRQRAVSALRASEESARLSQRAVEATANGILIAEYTTPDLTVTYVNPAFERITGYSAAEVIGKQAGLFMGTDVDQLGLQEIRSALYEGREGGATLQNHRKDGSLFWNDLTVAPVKNPDGVATHFVGVINDITERKQYEEQLERQNNQDSLTGLASRSLLKERTDLAIAFAARQNRSVALLYIDIDHFKRINESLGHSFGDALLRAVAARLGAQVRERDTLARLGGDDFVLVLSDLADPKDIPRIASKILRDITRPLSVHGREISLSASLGVSYYPQDGADYDVLLRNADAAMYRAKDAGRNTLEFYRADMNAFALQKLELESRLRHALQRDELLLHYQPLLGLNTNEITDVEALIRWKPADGPLVSPLEFIGLAEETGLIVPIGQWVLRTACAQAFQWLCEGHELRIAVNLSMRQFRDNNLVRIIGEALAESQLPPKLLKLEITESSVMENADQAIRILSEIKALGVTISVDDFGTGYSSLAYLRRFPIDQLKIDRTFVQDVIAHPDSASIVETIIGLAHNLRLQTVGEGVETIEQRDFLRCAGCDLMQGFLFSKPVPAQELIEVVRKHRPIPALPMPAP